MRPSLKSTSKMKVSSEVKVGLIGIVTLAVLIWGINYLKGRNILSNSYSINLFFSDAAGLEASAQVMMHGVKIGYVDEVVLLTGRSNPIRVILNMEKEYPVYQGSVGELFSADLLGTKAIRIIPSGPGVLIKDNDTISASFVPDLIDNLQDQVQPVLAKVNSLAASLDTLAEKLDVLLGSETIETTLQHLSSISSSLKQSLDKGGALNQSFGNMASFTDMLTSQQEEVASLVQHLNSVGKSLDEANLDQVAEGIIAVSNQLEMLLDKVNSGEGSVGKLIYSDSLHHSLERLVTDLDKLIRDLQENPEDYVQISVFGRSKREK